MNLHQLRQRKAELRSATKAIIDSPAGTDGLLTDEQRTDYDSKIGELDRVLGDEQRLERIAREDAEAKGKPLNGAPANDGIEYRVFADVKSQTDSKPEAWRTPEGDRVPVLGIEQRIGDYLPADDSAASEVGLNGFLRALVNGPRNDVERRALAEGAVASGGALLPTPLATEVIDSARTKNVAFQAGARTVPMTAKTLRMAKIISDPVPAWRAENANIVESDPVFGELTMTAKTLAVRFNVSRELLEDAPNLDAQLRTVMGVAFARGLDAAIFYGTGADNQPLGIANTPGITTVSTGANGAVVTGYGAFLDAILALETANEGKITAAVLAPRTSRTLAGLVDTTGQPIVAPKLVSDIPILSTTGIPINETQGTSTNASSSFIGDFNQVLVGIRTQLQITVLQERFAEVGQVGFVGWLRADVAIARPAAIARITGLRA